jgi:hypothetical protein
VRKLNECSAEREPSGNLGSGGSLALVPQQIGFARRDLSLWVPITATGPVTERLRVRGFLAAERVVESAARACGSSSARRVSPFNA